MFVEPISKALERNSPKNGQISIYKILKLNGIETQISLIEKMDAWLIGVKGFSIIFKDMNDIESYLNKKESNLTIYKICLIWIEILERLRKENCLSEFKSNMKKLTIIGFFCFDRKSWNGNKNFILKMNSNQNLNLNNHNFKPILSNQNSNTNSNHKANSSNDHLDSRIINYSDTAIYFHHVIDNSGNHISKTVKESYNFFKKFGLLISPVERIAYNINSMDDYIKIVNSCYEEVAQNFLNIQEEGALIQIQLATYHKNENVLLEKVISVFSIHNSEMNLFKLLMRYLNDLDRDIKISCYNNEVTSKSPKSENYLNAPQILKIKNNLLKNSMTKFTNDMEKNLYSKTPLPMNMNFYKSLAQKSHENLCFKTDGNGNTNLNKILDDSLKEIFTNMQNPQNSDLNHFHNFFNIPNHFSSPNSISNQIEKFLSSINSIFESQIKTRQDCPLFKEESFIKKNECDVSHLSDLSLDSLTEENFTIELLKKHSLNKNFHSNKSNHLARNSFNIPNSKTPMLLSSDSKTKKGRSSVLQIFEFNQRDKSKNKFESDFSSSPNEDDKILLFKNKTMEKNLKKKYHSNNYLIEKENEEVKKYSDPTLRIVVKKNKEKDSESEKSQNEEEFHKKEFVENDTKVLSQEKNPNFKIKTINSIVNKSETENLNLKMVPKLSNKKTDAKNKDCYIINNNIIVVDNKMLLNKNEMIEDNLNDKKESNHKLEVKKLETNSNIKPKSSSSTNINGGRCDRRGIPILKGSKKHKISFCDSGDRPKPLIVVSNVDSYKRFNILNTHGDNSDRSCSCCLII